MAYYSVTDFDLPYPAWPAPLKRIRRGALTAFVDKATGHLVAGYSYETCLYAVAISPEYPQGRLYKNLTTYSVTTSSKHSWPLYDMIAPIHRGASEWGTLPDGTYGFKNHVEAIAPIAEAINVPRGTTAAELVVYALNPLPVKALVAARRAYVDAYNAAIDGDAAAQAEPWQAEEAGSCAHRAALEPYRDKLRELVSDAETNERCASDATYGDEYERAWQRELRRRDREREREANAIAREREIIEREPEGYAPVVIAAPSSPSAPALRPGQIMLAGKVYG